MKFNMLENVYVSFVLAVFLSVTASFTLGAQEPAAPVLTDVQKLEAEAILLKEQLTSALAELASWKAAFGECAGTVGKYDQARNQGALEQERAAWTTKFEAASPGWTWDWKAKRPIRKKES